MTILSEGQREDYVFYRRVYQLTREAIKSYEMSGERVPCHLPFRLVSLERIIRSYHVKGDCLGGVVGERKFDE